MDSIRFDPSTYFYIEVNSYKLKEITEVTDDAVVQSKSIVFLIDIKSATKSNSNRGEENVAYQ